MAEGPSIDPERLAQAERAVRRGELKQALHLYRSLLATSPKAPSLLARIASIESLLQPSELSEPVPARETPQPLEEAATPEQRAEMLFERGDFAGALALYQRILAARPQHELARERLRELQSLAAMHSRAPAKAPDAAPAPADPAGVLESLLERVRVRRRG